MYKVSVFAIAILFISIANNPAGDCFTEENIHEMQTDMLQTGHQKAYYVGKHAVWTVWS